eukprot:764440-Amorphochlora_amoeboformis.AAC.1
MRGIERLKNRLQKRKRGGQSFPQNFNPGSRRKIERLKGGLKKGKRARKGEREQQRGGEEEERTFKGGREGEV